MNSNLAHRLLASIMGWEPQQLANERAALEFMGNMKYDGYDRFMPGMRFMSSLVQWLNRLEKVDRDEAFKFIKNKLVFISSTQMNYLVDLLYDTNIRPLLLSKATKATGKASYCLANKDVVKRFRIEKRSSLVIGLSDGAHIDILRRDAGFSNEQVLTNYYPDAEKIDDLLKKLQKDMKKMGDSTQYYQSIFLIDDFTASGKSFVRYDKKEKKYKGKLTKIIDQLCAENKIATDEEKKLGLEDKKHLSFVLDPNKNDIHIDIFFCMATQKAKTNIENGLDNYLKSRQFKKCVTFEIHIVQKLEKDLSDSIISDDDLMAVLKKPQYLTDEDTKSEAYNVGNTTRPYLGFDECALPLVLSHNTPNNSLPILWQDSEQFRGLFPRISRH